MTALGIDLGTTNTVVAAVRQGRVRVLADAEGQKLLPSVVSFPSSGEVLVGQRARARRLVDAKNTVFSVKRLIGRAWTSPEVTEARIRYPFTLTESPGHGPNLLVRGKEYTLPEISAFVLRRARAQAEGALGERVSRAVVTVPANFNELQRAATKVAGRVAGLEVLRILNEPTAAALAYGLGRTDRERVAVYDFGGGTFDCTLLELAGSVFEVLATSGDSFLGGDDLDTLLAERMSESFVRACRFDPRAYPDAFERLRLAAEGVKHALSTTERVEVTLQEPVAGGEPLNVPFTMTRAELEFLARPLVERTLAVTREALALAALSPSAFDTVVLVGGSTRMPLVRRAVEGLFGRAPRSELNPDEVVAIGAAIQAAALSEPRKPNIPPPPSPGAPSSRRMAAAPPVEEASPEPPAMRSQADSTLEIFPNLTIEPLAPPMDDGERATLVDELTPLAPPLAYPPSHGAYNESLSPVPPTTATLPPVPPVAPVFPVASGMAPPRPTPRPPPRSMPPIAPRPPVEPFGLDVASPVRPREPTRPLFGPDDTIPYGGGVTAQVVAESAATASAGTASAVLESARPESRPAESGEGWAFRPSQAPLLVDVTPRALVVETAGGFCDVVIPRNARIPCECVRSFTTATNDQRTVRVRVAQGEAELFAHNTFVGEVELAGLRPAPRGEVSVQLTFHLDASGLLRVHAKDVGTGRETEATLELSGVATEGSVSRMQARQIAERIES